MAKGIHDLGNGNGLIYLVSPSGSDIVSVLENTQKNAKKVKSFSTGTTASSLNRRAVGVVQINSIVANGSITGILVNGNNQIASPIAFTTLTPIATLHSQIALAINNHTPLTPYDVTASFVGDRVNLLAPVEAGSDINGYPVTVSYTGTISYTTSDMAGGSGSTEVYDESFGNRVFLDADYGLTEYTGGGTAVGSSITNAVEITNFVVPRSMNSAVDVQQLTLSGGVISPVRKSALTTVKLTNEGGSATDDLDYINTSGFSEGDSLLLKRDSYAPGTYTQVTDNGNIKPAPYSAGVKVSDINPQRGIKIGDINPQTSVFSMTVQLNGGTWEEVARTGSTSISDSIDVDTRTTPPVHGQALTFDSGDSTWKPATISGAGATNLAIANNTSTTLDVTSDTGTDATIQSATSSLAGLMPSADKTKSDFITITQPVSLDAMESDVADLTTLSGMPSNSTHLGTFSGTTIPNNVTVKSALQSLETFAESITGSTDLAITNTTATTLDIESSTGNDVTVPSATTSLAGLMSASDKTKSDYISVTQNVDLDAIESDVDDLTTLTGVPSNSTDLGTFSGVTISDFSDIKGAIQQLETAVESVTSSTNLAVANNTATTLDITSDTGTDATIPSATGSLAGLMPAADKTKTDYITITQAVDLDAMESDVADLTTLSGVPSNSSDLGTFTGTTISNNTTLKGALQELETSVETKIDGTLTANYVLKASDSNTATSSQIFDDASFVGVNTVVPSARLHVKGAGTTSATTTFRVEDNSLNHIFGTKDNRSIWAGVTQEGFTAFSFVTPNTATNTPFNNGMVIRHDGDYALQVHGKNVVGYFASNSSSNYGVQINKGRLSVEDGNASFGVSGQSARVHIRGLGTTSGTENFVIEDSAATGIMRVDDNGRAVFGKGGSITVSAIFRVYGTTGGFLVPTVTTAERDAFSSPVAGLIIFNTDTSKHQGFNGSTWSDFF